jgi:hypothetical protein
MPVAGGMWVAGRGWEGQIKNIYIYISGPHEQLVTSIRTPSGRSPVIPRSEGTSQHQHHQHQHQPALSRAWMITMRHSPPQESLADISVGSVVQVRCGGERGSLFRARVEGPDDEDDGTWVLRYEGDGQLERGVDPSRLRLRSDNPDFEPFLSLVEELREKLIELTPNRTDMASDLRGRLDVDLLRQVLANAHTVGDAIAAMAEVLGFAARKVSTTAG